MMSISERRVRRLMTTEMEYEAKSLLTKEEYEQLQHVLGKKQPLTQRNEYFDTQAFHLKDKTAALRIRTKEGKAVLTLKQQTDEGMVETHQKLEETDQALFLSGTLPEGAVKIAIESLLPNTCVFYPYGQLTTHRITYPYKDGLLCLDHSEYNHREDYEIEYEGTSMIQAVEVLTELLHQQQITCKPAANKVARFFSTSPHFTDSN